MKIYNKLIIDIGSGAVIDEDSFEYTGPLALCGGGGDAPAPPAKTATENALDEAQLKLLQDQNTYRQEMEPFQLEAMGYKRDGDGKIVKLADSELPLEQQLQNTQLKKSLLMAGYDPTGNKLTEEQMLAGMSDTEKSNYNVTKLTNQRQLDALEGKLPISPALESELAAEETQATELLSRKLGANWAQSTSGQSLMAKIKTKANLVREEARRGMITTSDAIANSQANRSARNASFVNETTGVAGSASTNKLNQMAGYITGVGSGFDNSMTMSSKLASERANKQNLAMQQWQTNANNSASTTNATITGGAMAAAAAAAA